MGCTRDESELMSRQVMNLLDHVQHGPMSLGEIIHVLKGRAFLILVLILSVPFCLPIPLIGLSVPFGVVISLIGLRLALRQAPYLPKRIQRIKVPQKLATQLLKGILRVVLLIERFSKPRLQFLVSSNIWHHLYGAIICFCGGLLLLPLPIPFSNVIPAIPIILLAAALLEEDGVLAILGIITFVLCFAFFGALFIGGAAMIAWLEQWFSGSAYDPDEEIPPALEEILDHD